MYLPKTLHPRFLTSNSRCEVQITEKNKRCRERVRARAGLRNKSREREGGEERGRERARNSYLNS